jgi:hypothetical protein
MRTLQFTNCLICLLTPWSVELDLSISCNHFCTRITVSYNKIITDTLCSHSFSKTDVAKSVMEVNFVIHASEAVLNGDNV